MANSTTQQIVTEADHKIYLLLGSSYHLMVVTKSRFLCGVGTIPLHYCRCCGVPYLDPKEAERCEQSHEIYLVDVPADKPPLDAPLMERR